MLNIFYIKYQDRIINTKLSRQNYQDKIIKTKLSRQNYQDKIIKTENMFFCFSFLIYSD